MPFYVRKAISVGPFRFNLSKSGVGLSVGVKGLRLGMGPRGNYVHMGRGGLYYRATLPPARGPARAPSDFAETLPQPATPAGSHGPMVEIESAAASTIVDSSSRELLEELRSKRRVSAFWPGVAAVFALLTLVAWANKWPLWVTALIVIAGVALTATAYSQDVLRKTVVVLYDFDSELERAFQRLHDAGAALAACAAAWHISAQGRVHDRRYHAGAANLVSRIATSIAKAAPPHLKTNIETLAIGVGKQTLHFFPDRVLIYEPGAVGAVGYKQVKVTWNTKRFIEEEALPRDAQVIDRTWKYVNKNGSPDKRFKDNRELPVCLYGELAFSSDTGLNELIQVSKSDVIAEFVAAIEELAKLTPQERCEANDARAGHR